jgi:NAD(P)-dependent dehydrogenase (short-subunit alcohol dehydrogenase family)
MPVAMITGGASWFSRETAKLLIDQGWQVALSDINQKALDDVVVELGGSNKAEGALLNVTDLKAVQEYVADLVARKGSIDALVNVAGGSNWLKLGRPAFHETKPEQWDLILKPNINGVLNCCYSVLPQMIKQKKGSIVSIASGMGLRGQKGSACYSAAKAAIIAFSQSLCQEVGPFGIRVNTIAPGSAESRWQPDVKTAQGQNFSPLGSRTSAKDVANAVTFLISERASHITGSCLDNSGGTSLH